VEGKAGHYVLTSALSVLTHLDPFQVMGNGELGFLWITDILNSGYEEQWRERMASEVVGSLGRYLFRNSPAHFGEQPARIIPILGFLSLSEKLDTARSTRFTALRILAAGPGYVGFSPMILPILTSSLLPTHPLQARHLALNIFLEFKSEWFPPQMENVPHEDLDKLVRAVGDPFQFPDLPLQDGESVDPPKYDPTMATAVLIEFASSDLWRNHLRRSNFTSFEEIVSTWDGKRAALGGILVKARFSFPEFLCTGPKIAMAIKRLEELQCLNTAEVVIMWAWTAGVVDPMDHDTWQLIGRDTLRFYQTYGMERMIALKRHVADAALDPRVFRFLVERHGGFRYGAGNSIEPPGTGSKDLGYMRLSQACQSRRLYHLFGYDPATRGEAVAVVDADKELFMPLGRPVIPASFMGWACDYP
jgi:hypothetical protein